MSTSSVQESPRDPDALRELRQATAGLLEGNLLDETTAWLLANSIMKVEAESRAPGRRRWQRRAGRRKNSGGGESEETWEDPDGKKDVSAIANDVGCRFP